MHCIFTIFLKKISFLQLPESKRFKGKIAVASLISKIQQEGEEPPKEAGAAKELEAPGASFSGPVHVNVPVTLQYGAANANNGNNFTPAPRRPLLPTLHHL